MESAANIVRVERHRVLLKLAEELVKELSLDLLSCNTMLAALSDGLKHTNALILAEGAHLLHPIDPVEQRSWHVAESHQTRRNHADVLVEELVEIFYDFALNQGKPCLVRLVKLNKDALVSLR